MIYAGQSFTMPYVACTQTEKRDYKVPTQQKYRSDIINSNLEKGWMNKSYCKQIKQIQW